MGARCCLDFLAFPPRLTSSTVASRSSSPRLPPMPFFFPRLVSSMPLTAANTAEEGIGRAAPPPDLGVPDGL